ncbi:MAG: NAD synthetase [Opitutae bacterium]|nr:NAD synthetase [Opitutae bacterium]
MLTQAESEGSAIGINLAYVASAILFILGMRMLRSADTARKGNQLSSLGMLMAIVATLLSQGLDYKWIAMGVAIGAFIGLVAAKKVKMTSMPEMVALFNGFGGLASLLVAAYGFIDPGQDGHDTFQTLVICLAVTIGAVTFTGSMVAYLKLAGKISGNATLFPLQKLINALVLIVIVGLGVILTGNLPDIGDFAIKPIETFVWLVGLTLLLGIIGVLPIGGGDMPVVIALLNSFSGLAASAAGFVIQNNVLIVAGCLVGASGLILTVIMCKAMNRTLGNVLFGGFGADGSGASAEVEGEMKPVSVEDAYYVLESAASVVFIPGYGMAVAQAQHAVKELGEILEENGCEVAHAIHPVAGRMPGHMNVLLAEADVPYEQLREMDDVNPTIATVDIAVVIGANDVVNPAALEDEGSPIYGMPIINVHQARNVFCLKRGQGKGFSGLVNRLFFRENVRMLYGDAKETITALVAQFKD